MSRKYISATGQNEGDEMEQTIETGIDEIQEMIESGKYASEAAGAGFSQGADVIISDVMTEELRAWLGDQPLVISFQTLPAMRRVVITRYARELSWLFHELGKLMTDQLDFVSKYDFFGGHGSEGDRPYG